MRRRKPLGFDAAAHERHHGWRSLLLRLAVCGGVTAFLWWSSGWAGLLVSLMLWAHVFAADLAALGGWAWRGLRRAAFLPVQGRFHQFKGYRIRVLDDELLSQRWLALDDLGAALGAPVPASSLRRRWPEALHDERDGLYVLDDAVLAWLRERRDERAGRLALWLEREVWYPARGRKAGTQKGAPPGAPP